MKHLKFLFLILISVCCLITVVHGDDTCTCDDDDGSYYCDCDFPTGWIIAIVIVSLLITFGCPILICFLCACACFSGRNRNKGGQVHYPPVAVVSQQQGMSNPGFHPAPGQTVMYPQQGYVYVTQPPPPYASVQMPQPQTDNDNQGPPAGWK